MPNNTLGKAWQSGFQVDTSLRTAFGSYMFFLTSTRVVKLSVSCPELHEIATPSLENKG